MIASIRRPFPAVSSLWALQLGLSDTFYKSDIIGLWHIEALPLTPWNIWED